METPGAEKLTLTIGSDRVQVTEIAQPPESEDFLHDPLTAVEDDPYLEKLADSAHVEGDFLDAAILAKIMGHPGGVDE